MAAVQREYVYSKTHDLGKRTLGRCGVFALVCPESEIQKKKNHQVIFLDVDGVLRPVNKAYCVNTIQIEGISIPVAGQEGSDFSRAAMSALRHIRESTGAVLVLSSEWFIFSANFSDLVEFSCCNIL